MVQGAWPRGVGWAASWMVFGMLISIVRFWWLIIRKCGLVGVGWGERWELAVGESVLAAVIECSLRWRCAAGFNLFNILTAEVFSA